MTIAVNDRLVSHSGDGSTTAFAYDFPIAVNTDLVVTLVSSVGVQTAQALTTNYSVTIGGDGTGSITFVSAPVSGDTVYIEGLTPITQPADYVESDTFPASSHEGSMDRLAKVAQENRRELAQRVKIPEGESEITLPSSATRSSKYAGYDSEGNPTALDLVNTSTSLTLGTGWAEALADPLLDEDLAVTVDTISELQNLLGTNAEDAVIFLGTRGLGDVFRWVSGDQTASVSADEVTTGQGDGGVWVAPSTDRTGASGAWKRDFSGTIVDTMYGTDNALSLVAAASAAAGANLLITHAWTLTAGATLSDNTIVIGAGGSITLNGADLRAFTMGNDCTIDNVRFTGANNSTSSSGDTAIYASAKSGVKAENCYFTNFKGAPVYIANSTEIDVNNNEFENNIGSGVITDGTTDIYIADSTSRVSACENIHKADATTPKNIAIFMTSFDSDGEVLVASVNENVIDGYARGGVFLADEAPLATFGTGDTTVSDNIIRNSGQQAIKIKNVGRTVVSGNVIDEFEVTGPESAGNRLQGAIFLNAGGNITCSNNTIFTSSVNATNGIVFAGLPTLGDYGTNPGPRSVFSLASNTVVGAPDHAVYVGQRVYDVEITGLVARDCGGWIWMDGGTTDATNDPAQNISVTGGSYRSRGSGGDNSALQIDDCKKVNVSNALIDEAGGFGIQVTGSTDVSLVGIDVLDAGQGSTNTAGLRIDGVTRLRARNLTLTNADGTTMTHGVSFNGTNIGLVIQACEIGGQTAAVTGTIANDTVLRDNKGFNGYEVALDASASATVAVFDGVRDYNLTGGTNVTDITGGAEGDIIWIRRGSADPTLVHNVSKIATADGSNVTLTAAGSAGPSIIGLRKRGSVWFEIARSG